MTCTLIGMYLYCTGMDPIFFRNFNEPAAPPRQVYVDPDPVYRSMGMRTLHEYFCTGRKIHPMDAEMCARGPHR